MKHLSQHLSTTLAITSIALLAACGTSSTGTTPGTSSSSGGGVTTDAGSDSASSGGSSSSGAGDTAGSSDTGAGSSSGGAADAGSSIDAGSSSGGVADTTTSTDAGSTGDATSNGSDGGSSSGGGPLSCVGKCGKYDKDAKCQCDSGCVTFKDCCDDYLALCKKPECKVDKDCDDKNVCTTSTCEKGACKHNPVADGGKCGGDGTGCKTAGKCEKGKCNAPNKPKGSKCDDGNLCTKDDYCQSWGSCTGVQKCNDNEPCTTDSCDKADGKCVNKAKNDGAYCYVSAFCHTKMLCKTGKCIESPAGDDKKDGDNCSDGDPCTNGDKCEKGQCKGAEPNKCDDKSECTLDKCMAKIGCVNTPTNKGNTCDDGKPCTENTKCNEFGKCLGDKKKDGTTCDDDKTCTKDDKCDNGVCKGTVQKDKACDDKNPCTKDDKCSSFGSCYGVSKCNDDESCTLDSCDKADGKCKNEPKKDKSSCSDGNSCTTESCMGGKCDAAPKKDGSSCNDGITCTKDDECTGGTCAGQPDLTKDGKSCTDSDPCTIGDKCAGGKCEGDKTKNACDDQNPCTLDACTKKSTYSKDCKSTPAKDGGQCDDGNVCTESDACMKGTCNGKLSTKCTEVLSDPFECGKNTNAWVFSPKAEDGKVTGWAIDKTPDEPKAKSPQCTANFNNGKNYETKDGGTAKISKGTMVSKVIDVKKNTQLVFWSWHDNETYKGSKGQVDRRTVETSEDDFKTILDKVELDNKKGKKAWETVTIKLDKSAGKKVKIRFTFDTIDAVNNTTPGWFIDDLKVQTLKN